MPIRFLRMPVHYSPEDSTSPAPEGRSAPNTGQPSSPGAGEVSPFKPPAETPEEQAGPGFWGIFLGILDLLLALGTVVFLIVLFVNLTTSPGAGQLLSPLMCATVFAAVLGVIFVVRFFKGKKRSRLWGALYLGFVPLFFYLIILFLGR